MKRPQQRRQQFREDVSRDGIHTKDQPEIGPATLPSFDLYSPIAKRQSQDRYTCSEKHIRAGPEFFIDGKPDIPYTAEYETCNPRGEHACGLLDEGSLRSKP